MEPLYKMVHYKAVSDIRPFKVRPSNHEMRPIQTKMYRLLWSFFYIIYTVLFEWAFFYMTYTFCLDTTWLFSQHIFSGMPAL